MNVQSLTFYLTVIGFAAISAVVVAQDQEFVEFEGKKFPAPAALRPPPIPADNLQTLDEDGWPLIDDPKSRLGELLFFDTRLSGDNSVSCATCHEPDQGWGLNSAISRGYPGTSHWRNSHTVINSAYMWKLFWAGSENSLEVQARTANTGLSGNGKNDMMEERLRQVPYYIKTFKEVFGSDLPILEDAWRAIAVFQRTLTQSDTPFDEYMNGDEEALDEMQIRGLELFKGKAGCIQCHNGQVFSDQKYYNTGVPLQESFLEDPLQQITHRFEYYNKGVTENLYRKGKIDLGLYFSSHRDVDIGKFRVQPLRYLIYTPPYMHNGVFDDLEEVVDFYNDGGGEDLTEKTFGIANKSPLLKKLDLTDEEKEDLVAFLESLTGEEIYMDPPEIPDPMAFVYQGETYIGLPIPVVSANVEDRVAEEDVKAVTWSLTDGPEGMTIEADSGRVTWANVQPPDGQDPDGERIPITIRLRSETADGDIDEQTLHVTVISGQAPRVAAIAGGA